MAGSTLFHTVCALAATTLVAAWPACAAPATDVPTWYRATSEHFIAYSDQSPADTTRRLKALEQFRLFAPRLLPDAPGASSDGEPTLYLLNDVDSLSYVASNEVAGLYSACREGRLLFSADGLLDRRPRHLDRARPLQDTGLTLLFHEYSHHLMLRGGPTPYPLWYTEGLAEYLSTFTYDGQAGHFGAPPYRDQWLLARVNWGEWDRVLAPDDKLSSGLTSTPQADPAIFYAKAWLLTHYMLSDPARARALQAYFDRLRLGEDPVAAFKTATGIDPIHDLPQRLHDYSRNLPTIDYALPASPDTPVSITTLPATTDSYIMGSAALQTCPAPQTGRAMLKTLKSDVGPMAGTDERTALAYGEILFGDPKAPIDDLTAISPGDSLYPRAQYLLGRAWLAAGDRGRAAAYLEKALSLSPADPPTLYFLAHADEARPGVPAERALDEALTAARAVPSVYDYAAYAARLELQDGDRERAQALLRPFTIDLRAPVHAQHVAAIATAIGQGKTATEVGAMMDTLSQSTPAGTAAP